jgi:hypothetical protein
LAPQGPDGLGNLAAKLLADDDELDESCVISAMSKASYSPEAMRRHGL